MSTEETAPTEIVAEEISDNLDDFSNTFFNKKAPEPEPESPVEPVEPVVATEELSDTDAPDEDEPILEEVPAEPKKKSRYQERIDELTNKAKEAERKAEALLADFEAFKAKLETPTPAPTVKPVEDTGPRPDDQTEAGEDKYPLGEFDPNYIRDLTKHTFKVERESAKAEEDRARYTQSLADQKAALQSSWEEKLTPARERYPDFQEKSTELVSSFDGIETAYGEYLTSTLMSMDHGTDVLYYLANNPDEAKKIIASGAAKATITFGRIEAKFADADEATKRARPKVSQAPQPPAHQNKGSAVVEPPTPPDTDDLDAFAKTFFKKSRRS